MCKNGPFSGPFLEHFPNGICVLALQKVFKKRWWARTHGRTHARWDAHTSWPEAPPHNKPFGQLDYTRDCNVVPEGPTTAGDSFYFWHLDHHVKYLWAFQKKVICWHSRGKLFVGIREESYLLPFGSWYRKLPGNSANMKYLKPLDRDIGRYQEIAQT